MIRRISLLRSRKRKWGNTDEFDPERVRTGGFGGGGGESGGESQALDAVVLVDVAMQDGCRRDQMLELGSREMIPVDWCTGKVQLRFKAPCSSTKNDSTLASSPGAVPELEWRCRVNAISGGDCG